MSEINEKKHLKLLQCGDIHLDTPYTGISAEKSEERRRELRRSFNHMMQYIHDRGVDIVLMCGDIFDTVYATNTTAEVLIHEFKNCPDATFIITPGSADSYENNPIYTSGRLPKNCHVIASESLTRLDLNEYNVTIYGWGFRNGKMTENPLYDRRVDDISRINIVCGYADLDGPLASDMCPISTADLKRFGADYYAFGSRHQASETVRVGASFYTYCGSLECTGFDNPGIGGANLIVVDDKNGGISFDVRKLTFGHLCFYTEKIDITGVDAYNEIINRISRLISEKKYGIETALRIELVGYVDPRFIIPKNLDSESFGLYYFDMIDKTLPLWGTEKLKRDMSVKGELFRNLLPMLEGESEEDRLVAARAFRMGLAALENREIDI
ncbi:MAG: metallophosphoesterase [Clostridia bacterium]|nr:metallophosphoesterase [Clostridia bacterium]